MNNLKINLIAFPGASKEIIQRGENILQQKLSNINIEITDQNPDAIFVITGGSELQAKNILKDKKRMLILAMTEGNSYAAASEIKSFCNLKQINSILYNIDFEKDIQTKIEYYIKSNKTLNKLTNYKIGLIGNVSEWLINSTIDNSILKNKLGIQIEQISWNDFPKYSEYPTNTEFINHFNQSDFDLQDSSRVYNLIHDMIRQKAVDAITVECFPLVRENAVTACLALSKLNTDGFASGCEGDITSITGKVICKELTGQVPWMANLAALDDDKIFFAHCTIATDLVSDYKIRTHFETNEGTAVQGQFKSENVTVMRLSSDLTKAFLSYGRVVERPEREDSCRTQIKVEIPTVDIQKLKENPLGNHHLIISGNHTDLFKYFFKLNNIELI